MSISDEIRASAAAHRDLGPMYDGAVAEGLVERIGEEIDRRVDIRLGTATANSEAASAAAMNAAVASLAAARGRRARARALAALAMARTGVSAPRALDHSAPGSSRLGFSHVVLALGSMVIAMAATGILTHPGGLAPAGPLIALIWIIIAIINVGYARSR